MLIIVLDRTTGLNSSGFFCKVDDFLEEMYSKPTDLFFYHHLTSDSSPNSLWIRDPFNKLFISVEEVVTHCECGVVYHHYRASKMYISEFFRLR